jgi:hypothetical protein
MFREISVVAAALGLLLAAGCNQKPPTPTVNASMTQVMAPQTQTIWDITTLAFNDKGDGLDAAKISPADWAKLEEAGRQLRDRALLLANAPHVTAAAPGETIMGADAAGAPSKIGHAWDAASAKQVQALIDANPALFAQRARALADAGDTVFKAAKARDVGPLYKVSSGMDEVCDGCHQKFWGTDEPPPYPK